MDTTRRIDLGGPVNFRDIGGYRAADGRTVRHGRIFRSDGLWDLTADDVAHLLEARGLKTIVDLRGPTELQTYGRGPLEAHALPYHHVPFFDETLRPDVPVLSTNPQSWTLTDTYLFIVRQAAERVARVIGVLADPANQPAVVHCTAGKDRTGVVVGLILSLIGVSDEDVADDYALTADVMPRWMERTTAFWSARQDEPPQFSQHVLSADRDTMLDLLRLVREEFGSVEAWASRSGVGESSLTLLRASLLD